MPEDQLQQQQQQQQGQETPQASEPPSDAAEQQQQQQQYPYAECHREAATLRAPSRGLSGAPFSRGPSDSASSLGLGSNERLPLVKGESQEAGAPSPQDEPSRGPLEGASEEAPERPHPSHREGPLHSSPSLASISPSLSPAEQTSSATAAAAAAAAADAALAVAADAAAAAAASDSLEAEATSSAQPHLSLDALETPAWGALSPSSLGIPQSPCAAAAAAAEQQQQTKKAVHYNTLKGPSLQRERQPHGRASPSPVLTIDSIRRLQVSPHPAEGRAAPRHVVSGITECTGTFAAAASLSVCCVLWTPLEDPLEVFSVAQGTHWLPGWGRRVTSAVCTRPCAEKNALGQDEVDVQQQLELPISSSLPLFLREETAAAAAAASQEFDGGVPLAFVSVLHIHEKLNHDLGDSFNPYRLPCSSVSPHNLISNEGTPTCPKTPCLSVLGTAVAPLPHLLALSKKSLKRVDLVKREETDLPVAVSLTPEGRLAYASKLKLFDHKEVWAAVSKYQRRVQLRRRTSLLALLLKFCVSPSCGFIETALVSFRPKAVDWQLLLGRRWRGSALLAGAAGGELPEQQRQQQQLEALGPACAQPRDVARRLWIGVKRVCSLPLVGPAKGLLEASSLSVVAAWLPESRNKLYFRRRSRKVTSTNKCELEPQPFDVLSNAFKAEEELFGLWFGASQLVLPTLPGIDPLLCLFVCVDGEPYAQLRQPLDLLSWEREALLNPSSSANRLHLELTAAKAIRARRDGRPSLVVPFASSFGFLEVSLKREPKEGLFLSSQEFQRLNLKPDGHSDVNLRTGVCSSKPDFYGAPVVGPYGQWTVFLNDVEPEDESGSEEGDEGLGDGEDAKGPAAAAFPFASYVLGAAANAAAAAAASGASFFSPALPRGSRKAQRQKPRRRGFLEILREVEEEEMQKKAATEQEAAEARAAAAAVRHSPRGPGPVVADMCVAEGPGLKGGIVGEWCCFSLRLKNRKGETVTETEGTVRVLLEALGHMHFQLSGEGPPAGGEAKGGPCAAAACRGLGLAAAQQPRLRWETREDANRALTVRYRYDYPGRFLLHVNYDGLPVAGAPFEVTLISGAPCPMATKVLGRGSRICFASPCAALEAQPNRSSRETEETLGEDEREDFFLHKGKRPKYTHFVNHFKVLVCDAHGNRVPIGGHCVSVRASGGARLLRVRDEGDGSYTVFYIMRASASLLLKAALHHLKLADAVANLLTYEQRLASDELVQQTKELQRQGLLPFRSCRLEVFLFEKPILASPLEPLVANLEALQKMYLQAEAATRLGASIARFEEQLRQGKHDEAARTLECVYGASKSEKLWKEAEEALARISLRDALHQSLNLQGGDSDDETPEGLLELTQKDRTENEMKKLRGLQQQWEEVQAVRQVSNPISRLSRDAERQQQVMHAFTESMLLTLQRTQTRNLRLLAEKNDVMRLRDENLVPLAEVLQMQYFQMFTTMTKQIVSYVSSLKDRDFFNLEELLDTYKKIGQELRSLHRYALADLFDELSLCVCEEVELQRLEHVYSERQRKCGELEKAVAEKENQLNDVVLQHDAKFRNVEPLDLEEVAELCVTKAQKGEPPSSLLFLLSKVKEALFEYSVQTEDALSLREGALGPLIVSRATGQRAKAPDPVCALAKRHWRTCNAYEMHTSIRKLLKSTPRLKLCLQEIFAFYSKAPRDAVLQRWQSLEGLPVGLTQPAFMRFCWDLKLQENLLTDPTQLACFFEKFSVEPDEGLIRPEGFLRILPLFLWLPCVRELAYLNLVHALSAEVVSSGLDASSSALKLSHPSRLVAFHHFCTVHLVPLYEYLYNSQDFRLSNAPLMGEARDAADSSTAAAAAAAVEDVVDLLLYSRHQLPTDVLAMLRLEPLEHLFAFYGKLSRHPACLHSKRQGGITGAAAAAGAAGGQQLELGKRSSKAPAASLQPPQRPQASEASGDNPSPSSSKEETAAAGGWVSVGVFVRMLRELGILPGFLSLEAAKAIALVSSSTLQNHQLQQEKEQQDNTEHKVSNISSSNSSSSNSSSCNSSSNTSCLHGRLQPMHAVGSVDFSSPAAARGAPAAAGAAPPPAAAAAPSLCCSVTQIREEARQLLDVFGLLSLPSVMALTTTRAPD
ncbi:hypothetical protein Esti_004011 [Eimeria stiedai]